MTAAVSEATDTSPAIDVELVLDLAIAVLAGDVVLDEDGGEHLVVRASLHRGRVHLVGADGWAEAVGVDQWVGFTSRGGVAAS